MFLCHLVVSRKIWYAKIPKQILPSNNECKEASIPDWLPWLLNIITDIPSHTAQFFPTQCFIQFPIGGMMEPGGRSYCLVHKSRNFVSCMASNDSTRA